MKRLKHLSSGVYCPAHALANRGEFWLAIPDTPETREKIEDVKAYVLSRDYDDLGQGPMIALLALLALFEEEK